MPFTGIIQILSIVLVFNPEKLRDYLPLRYVSWRYIIMFSVAGVMLKMYST